MFEQPFERGFAILVIVLSCAMPFFGKSLLQIDMRTMDFFRDAASEERARIAAAVQRRQLQEHVDRVGRVFFALIGLAIGIVGLLRIISLPLFATLLVALITIAVGLQVLRTIYLRTGARVAQLEPRGLFTMVPAWYVALPVIAWVCCAYVAWKGDHVGTAIIAIASSIAALVFSSVAARLPAVVSAEDPAADEAVDRFVRMSRIGELLLLAAGGPFIVAELIFTTHDGVSPFARFVCVAVYSTMLLGMQARRKRAFLSL